MVNSYEACKKGNNSADIQIEKGGTTMACKTTKKNQDSDQENIAGKL